MLSKLRVHNWDIWTTSVFILVYFVFISAVLSPENTDRADLYLIFICMCMMCVIRTVFQATF